MLYLRCSFPVGASRRQGNKAELEKREKYYYRNNFVSSINSSAPRFRPSCCTHCLYSQNTPYLPWRRSNRFEKHRGKKGTIFRAQQSGWGSSMTAEGRLLVPATGVLGHIPVGVECNFGRGINRSSAFGVRDRRRLSPGVVWRVFLVRRKTHGIHVPGEGLVANTLES